MADEVPEDEHDKFLYYQNLLLSQLTFQVSEELFATHLKVVDAELTYYRKHPEEAPVAYIEELEKQKTRRERDGKPTLNYHQAYDAFIWADNDQARKWFYEKIVLQGIPYRQLIPLLDACLLSSSPSPLEEEENERYREIIDAELSRNPWPDLKTDAGSSTTEAELPDSSDSQTKQRSARVREYEKYVGRDEHTRLFEDFVGWQCAIQDVFWDSEQDTQKKWSSEKAQEAIDGFSTMLYNSEFSTSIAPGEWQAQMIAKRYVDTIQKARELALGEAADAGRSYSSDRDPRDSGWDLG